MIMEPHLIKSNPSFIGQHPSMDRTFGFDNSLNLLNRRSESAERYFGWAGKGNRK